MQQDNQQQNMLVPIEQIEVFSFERWTQDEQTSQYDKGYDEKLHAINALATYVNWAEKNPPFDYEQRQCYKVYDNIDQVDQAADILVCMKTLEDSSCDRQTIEHVYIWKEVMTFLKRQARNPSTDLTTFIAELGIQSNVSNQICTPCTCANKKRKHK